MTKHALATAAVAAFFGISILVLAGEAAAQATADGSSLEIDAEEGIEWRQEEKVYIARGNVRAASGDLEIFAQEMSAYYKEGAEGNAEIFLIDVVGDVRIESPSGTVYGQHGQYVVEESRFELRGSNLKLVNAENGSTVTAKDSLEYLEKKNQAIASGDAKINQDDKQVEADRLVAYFEPGKGDKLDVVRVEAAGNVRIKTPNEFVVGDEGVYYVKEERATLSGDVKITRGENQLNGQYAEVNLTNGVSKLLAAPPGSGTKSRVQGLILPKSNPTE